MNGKKNKAIGNCASLPKSVFAHLCAKERHVMSRRPEKRGTLCRKKVIWLPAALLLLAGVRGFSGPYAATTASDKAGITLSAQQRLEVGTEGMMVVLEFQVQDVSARKAKDGSGFFSGLPAGGYPGRPMLPAQNVRVLLPPDANPKDVSVAIRNPVIKPLDGEWDIPAAPPYAASDGRIVWPTNVRISDGRDTTIYSRNAFYPDAHIERAIVGRLRQWKIAVVTVYPYRYNPVTKKLHLLQRGELVIDYKSIVGPAVALRTPRPGTAAGEDRRRTLASSAINFESVAGAYSTEVPQPQPGDGSAEFVIITTSSIVSQSTRLSAFITAKTGMGFSVAVITEGASEDSTHYVSGSSCNQRADNIRSWLENHYGSLGIEYVLLLGNPHPSSFASSYSIPMKMCYPRRGEGTYEESPTDMYFAELTGDWDNNSNGYYGEYADVGSGGIDMMCEVQVGRIPVYDTGSTQIGYLDSILDKTVAYESSETRDWRENYLGSAGFQDNDFTVDGAEMIQQFRNNVCTPNGWSTLRLYQQGSRHSSCDSIYSSDYELRGAEYGSSVNHHHYHWQQNDYGVVMWWGHGSSVHTTVGPNNAPDGTLFQNSYASGLDNNHPSFLFPNSCNNGYPETTDNLCVSVLRNGGIASLSPSRVSWYAVATWQTYFFGYCSDNASYNYYTAKQMIENEDPIGDAITWTHANGGLTWWEGSSLMNHFDFNIYGDPSVGLYTMPPPSPPTDVSASDGTYTAHARVTWNSVSGATHYRVYRATSEGGAKTALGSWQTGTTYDDSDATPGVTYYYWVKAATDDSGSNASDYSDYDTGWRALNAPSGVSATDGTHTDKVRVTWSTVTGATHYRVYRAASEGGAKTALGSWQTTTTYDDGSTSPGVTYYYSVKAAVDDSGTRASGYSSENSGWRALSAPGGISATDGTYTDKVRVTWSTVTGATHYRVYRAASEGGAKTALGSWQAATSYDDTSATAGTTYYYSVQAATDDSGTYASDYSSEDSGWRLLIHTITANKTGNGTITPAGDVTVEHGGTTNFLMEADPTYHIESIKTNDSHTGGSPFTGNGLTSTNYTWSNIVADGTVTVHFAMNTYTITVSKTGCGTVTPAGASVEHGGSTNFTVTADPGLFIWSVKTNGVNVAAFGQGDTNYVCTFNNVTSDQTLVAEFETNAVARHWSEGYHSPGTNLISNDFTYPTNREMLSLKWQPALPSGWTMGTASGDGGPQVTNGTEIVFTGSLSTNPIAFSYTVITPAGSGWLILATLSAIRSTSPTPRTRSQKGSRISG